MIGGEAMLRTLVAAGVDTCFMNPGTSEMHFVASLDAVPTMRGVLALFEGVATGAADGYGRMTGRPAAVLLHLGPGLGNGLANLHNARRAFTPLLAVVGDHATTHQRFDAPLQSDIEAVASSVSRYVGRVASPDTVAGDTLAALSAASGPPGGVATLILPADHSWTDGAAAGTAPGAGVQGGAAGEVAVPAGSLAVVAAALRDGSPSALLVGSSACGAEELAVAAAIAGATGATLLCETFPARLARGAGRPAVGRLPYLGEMAASQLAGLRHLVLVGAASPVSFFAYPGRPSDLVPDGCTIHRVVDPGHPSLAALAALADELGAPPWTAGPDAARPACPTGGPLTAASVSAAIGALLPDGAVVCDESNTSGLGLGGATAGSPPHDWLTLTGGAIGQGLPLACGAAIAAPGRRVVVLESDGSALYTSQALWTMAREGLDVTTVIYNNRSYAILTMELERTGAGEGGPRARRMLDLGDPDVDFVALAAGYGVPARRASTTDEFTAALAESLSTPGPSLIEAILA